MSKHRVVILSLGALVAAPIIYKALAAARDLVRSICRHLSRWVKMLCITPPLVQPSLIKPLVFEVQYSPATVQQNHTHPTCAALRNSSVNWIERACAHIGRTPVWLQARASDVRAGRLHDTEWFWSKDIAVPQRVETLLPTNVAVLVDTDYYVDLPAMLTSHPDVVFALFTFTPSDAGAVSDEYSYCFRSDGKVDMCVSGGARFKHLLWNYASDHLSASAGWWDGTNYRLVERRQVGPDWSVVWLWPSGSVRWGTDWLLRRLGLVLDANPLVRFQPVDGDFARFLVVSDKGTEITTARLGSYSACTIDADVDSMVRAAAYATTVTLTNHTVQSYGVSKDAAIFLTDYWRAPQQRDVLDRVVVGNAPSVIHYDCGPSFDEESKPSVSSFMDPFVTGGAFAPFVSEGNMACAIQSRVLDITDHTTISPFIEECMSEFIERVLDEADVEAHTLNVSDIEQILERQSSKQQKMQVERAAVSQLDKEQDANAFMKREPYSEIKEPRVISNFKEVDKTVYAVMLDRVVDMLKNCGWYSFVEPAILEERLLTKLGGAKRVAETDFSRMDGRYGVVLRLLEFRLCLRVLTLDAQEKFLTEYKRDHHKRVFAAFDLCYLTEWHRLSGAFTTSAFNTLGNAFCQYVVFRTKFAPGGAKRGYPKQTQYEPSKAYSMIGMCGGDDGIVALPMDFDAERFTYGCGLCGQKVVLEEPKGPVSFLGRYYGELRAHSANSCADVRRQLVKFHLTTDANADPLKKFCEKAYAFAVLDSNTPLLGSLGRKAVRLLSKAKLASQFDFRDGALGYNAAQVLLHRKTVFTNYAADWMWAVVSETLPGFDVRAFVLWTESDQLRVPKPFLAIELALVCVDPTVHAPKVTPSAVQSLRKKKKKARSKPTPDSSGATVRTVPPKEKEEV